MFVARRGPHRICVKPSAGCVVIADLGTRSAAASDGPAAVPAVGVKAAAVCRRGAVGRRPKMLAPGEGEEAVGRRAGSEEKALWEGEGDEGSVGALVSARMGGLRANLVRHGCCRDTSRTAARTADWAEKRRDIVAAGREKPDVREGSGVDLCSRRELATLSGRRREA